MTALTFGDATHAVIGPRRNEFVRPCVRFEIMRYRRRAALQRRVPSLKSERALAPVPLLRVLSAHTNRKDSLRCGLRHGHSDRYVHGPNLLAVAVNRS